MNVPKRMNAVMDYIENHITENFNLETLAEIAGCSSYNFQRMFSYITDISIAEYIRKRRLSLAALELQKKGVKVIDAASKYGYDSPVSFTRAFQALHGISPSAAKKSNVPLKMFPKITFQITIKGANEMNYRIVKTPPFKVFGLGGWVSTVGDENYYPAGAIWQENHANGKYEQLGIDAGEAKSPLEKVMFIKDMCRIHAVMNYEKGDGTKFTYMQCCLEAPDSKTDGYNVVEIPETTWGVFGKEAEGWDVGSALAALNKHIYNEWLPSADYEKADGAEFEMYGGTLEQGYIELWIPIIKK